MTKINDEVKKKILCSIKKGAFINDACEAAGIHRQTYYLWKRKAADDIEPYKSFFVELDKVRQAAICTAVGTIFKAGKKQWQAMAWWLERTYPQRYAVNRLDVPASKLLDDELFDRVEETYHKMLDARKKEGVDKAKDGDRVH